MSRHLTGKQSGGLRMETVSFDRKMNDIRGGRSAEQNAAYRRSDTPGKYLVTEPEDVTLRRQNKMMRSKSKLSSISI